MEILPVDAIKDDLEAMALVRMELFRLQELADRQLIDLNLEMLRNMGATGLEYELSEKAAKAMSMLSIAQEKVRKDGMIGQLELKSGVVATLEEDQYHEKKELSDQAEETDEELREMKQKQKEQSVLFIANQMGAKMRQISLAEEDFYYYVKDLLQMWRERERLLAEEASEEDPDASDAPDEFEQNVEQISTLTESYLAGYLKVTNTIKDVVMRKRLLIVIHK